MCGKIAEDYEGWQYVAGIFKNKNLKHTVKIMDPRWGFQPQSVLMQPITIVLNKKIAALKKKIFNRKSSFTSSVIHNQYVVKYDFHSARIYGDQLQNGQAEKKIRIEMDTCIEILEKQYSYATEENDFLENLPFEPEGILGLEYCLVRAYLNDFDFVLDYRANKVETIRPKRYADVDKIIEYFEIKK